ncbi:aminotransferase class III [Actinokineospora auranticolor]|uniref:Diaminobutyrate--2-oxoglutarate transaminase n=1 Tax=Actinokineospora auranticolor TaxID=155976 RepID=A0A2S6GJ97_9PSEU|nr:aminotransferase class III [Actinokineospora auranticolor]
MTVFDTLESAARSYSRSWPVVFHRARGAHLYTERGRPYLDFFAGAGALNYGHNEPSQKQALLEYLAADGITHSPDMFTAARREFLETFDELVLRPRAADYKMIFPGPGGANAVQAALTLARRVTGRTPVISFTRGFHGTSLGTLAASGDGRKRAAACLPLTNVIPMPYDGYLGTGKPDAASPSPSSPAPCAPTGATTHSRKPPANAATTSTRHCAAPPPPPQRASASAASSGAWTSAPRAAPEPPPRSAPPPSTAACSSPPPEHATKSSNSSHP